MFKITDRILTPDGPGVIVDAKISTYSKRYLFWIVDLDNGTKGYQCPIHSAKELK